MSNTDNIAVNIIKNTLSNINSNNKRSSVSKLLYAIKIMFKAETVSLYTPNSDDDSSYQLYLSTNNNSKQNNKSHDEYLKKYLKNKNLHNSHKVFINQKDEIQVFDKDTIIENISQNYFCVPIYSKKTPLAILAIYFGDNPNFDIQTEAQLEILLPIIKLYMENIFLNERINLSEQNSQSIQEILRDGIIVFNTHGKAISINKAAANLLNLKTTTDITLSNLAINPQIYINGSILYYFDPIVLFKQALESGNTTTGQLTITRHKTRYIRVYFNLIKFSDVDRKFIYMTLRDITKSRLEQNQLYTMYKTGMDIVISSTSETPLAEVAQNANTLFDSQFAEIYLYDKLQKRLEFTGGIGYRPNREKTINLGEGLLGLAAKEKSPKLSNHINKRNHSTNSMVVPLLQGKHLLGVLHVGDARKRKAFTEEDLTALILFGSQAAVAIKTSFYIKELTAQKERLEAIFKNIVEGISITDNKHKIISFNPAAEKITGWSAREAVGKFSEIIFNEIEMADDGEKYATSINRAIKTRKIIPYKEVLLKTKYGEQKYVEVCFIPQKNEDGEVVGVVKVTRDISKHKEVEQLKNDFVSIASHELRTPLTVMNGYLNLFLEGYLGKLDDQQKKFIEQIYNDTNDLTRLVEDLLNVSRIEKGNLKINSTDFTLNTLIEKVVDGLKYRMENKNITMKMKSFGDINIFADKRKIEQILLNLLDNSIKYTHSDGTIEIYAKYSKNGIIITVKDNGVGIDKEYRDRLFSKFQRIPNVLSNKEGGTGLGLYITQGFVTAHNGKIVYRRRKTGGSIFEIWLPLRYKP